MALKCIRLPSKRRGGRGKTRKKEERTTDKRREEGEPRVRRGSPFGPGRHCLWGPRPLPRPARPRHTLSAGARPSARAFVHIHPSKKASSPPGRAPREEGGERNGSRAPDTDPAAGRVLLIHFPLALARPGRQGAGRGGEEMGAPLGRTVRASEGTERGCGRTPR